MVRKAFVHEGDCVLEASRAFQEQWESVDHVFMLRARCLACFIDLNMSFSNDFTVKIQLEKAFPNTVFTNVYCEDPCRSRHHRKMNLQVFDEFLQELNKYPVIFTADLEPAWLTSKLNRSQNLAEIKDKLQQAESSTEPIKQVSSPEVSLRSRNIVKGARPWQRLRVGTLHRSLMTRSSGMDEVVGDIPHEENERKDDSGEQSSAEFVGRITSIRLTDQPVEDLESESEEETRSHGHRNPRWAKLRYGVWVRID